MTEDKLKQLTSIDDSELFRSSVGDIKRLHSDKAPPSTHRKKSRQPTSQHQTNNHLVKYHQTVSGGEKVFFVRDGVNSNQIKQFKRGNFELADCLDLHGYTENTAKAMVEQFISSNHEHSNRYLMIIHGKGLGSGNKHPILKNLVINLLKSNKNILAYTSAQDCDGGSGAVYVLLKK